IKKVFKEHAELALLLDACQNTVGKVFNSVEANTVLVMRDYLCLEPEYILALMAYCKEKGKTSLKYMERMAYTLTDKGIDSFAALEDHLRRKDKYDSSEEFLRRMFGIGDRALTAKEHSAFTRWSIDWELDTELIRKAYETTVNAIGKPSVPYADKILEKWHSAGYEKPGDVPEPESQQSRSGEGSFGTDEFFEAALKRSYNRKMKGGGEDQL
ncbi:MAG: DnaD domain protein, partial [Clostridia bacterium]|nr:DnaD domain protein [Clostridia bacterium]